MNDENTVDFFTDLNGLKYTASQAFTNSIDYIDRYAGWVRYRDIVGVVNEEVESRNRANTEIGNQQQKLLEDMKEMLIKFGDKLTDIESNQLTLGDIPTATSEDIQNLFRIENKEEYESYVGQEDVGNVPVDSAFLLVYAAAADGQIIKTKTLSAPTQIFISGKQFISNNSKRESARWVEALDRLIEWKWVKSVGYKGEIFELTGTGYNKAEWLKECMDIDTSKEPFEEFKEFE